MRRSSKVGLRHIQTGQTPGGQTQTGQTQTGQTQTGQTQGGQEQAGRSSFWVRARDWFWVAMVAMIWFTMPLLKIQVARVIPFDAIMGTLLVGMVFVRTMGGKRSGSGPSWRARCHPAFYLSMMGLVFAGLLSGLHAAESKIWAIEVVTFLYLAIMMRSMDMFSGGQLERFLKVGTWTFAGVCALTGTVAGLFLLGGPKVEWFFEVNRVGFTDKFTGMMRYSNQWSGYFVSMFPLLLALAFSDLKRWQRPLLVGCALLGVLTVPASGSRSGLFLLAAEAVGFFALYLMLNRSDKTLKRVVYLGAFLVLFGIGYTLLIDQLADSPIVQRSFGAFELVFEQEEFSDDWRDYNWRAALTMFEKHPIIGIGLGTFELYYDRHEIHSTYLSFLTEAGVVGFIFYALVIGLPAVLLVRSLLVHIAHGRTNVMLIALLVAIGAQFLFAIHHNNARHRHVWSLLLLGMLYADVSLLKLRRELRQARATARNPNMRGLRHRM